jgi:hypothetical protein
MFTTETISGRPLRSDAFEVLVSLAAGRSLRRSVAPDASRLLDVFPYCGPSYTAAEQWGLLPMPRHGAEVYWTSPTTGLYRGTCRRST